MKFQRCLIVRVILIAIAVMSSTYIPFAFARTIVITGTVLACVFSLFGSRKHEAEFGAIGGMGGGFLAAAALFFFEDYGPQVTHYIFYSIVGSVGVVIGGVTGTVVGIITRVSAIWTHPKMA